ncbi:hypothetical protein M6B38_330670 [Iris pallida]|uniref:Uncharacterized protein n=1 Tax=Iris pallida TaxID=29817 RepID=A0AAX6H4N3_IRIPA|nr:hypothetical protein M6B38_237975 [Iris pallida]KAJ6835694.1 hypothetical protein M6B38_330670 [Iris pallida]
MKYAIGITLFDQIWNVGERLGDLTTGKPRFEPIVDY